MTRLLVVSASPEETAAATRFGGRPLVPADAAPAWPTCRRCKGAMQFLGQLLLEDGKLLALFMCQNAPGACEEWDADAGGNAAWIVDASQPLALLDPPSDGQTALDGTWGGTTLDVEVADADVPEHGSAYDVARSRQPRQRDVLGVLGGEPAWIQGDETPTCDTCGEAMTFVALLEQGPDHRTEINFGGGCAYAFRCGCGAAKMLWQQ